MSITKEEVSYVADLARLSFTDAEVDKLAEDLGAILDHANQLNELDTGAVKPTEHLLALENVLRPDEVKPSLPLEQVLANAPEAENGCFVVPRVLE